MHINIAALALASSLSTGMATPALDRQNYSDETPCTRHISLPIELITHFSGSV